MIMMMMMIILQVVVEKFPTKKDFSVDLVEFSVDVDDAIHLTLTWTPSNAMRCREMVIFRVDESYRLQAILLGYADEPVKPHKVCNIASKHILLACIAVCIFTIAIIYCETN